MEKIIYGYDKHNICLFNFANNIGVPVSNIHIRKLI